jgi:hypothetical protein
MPNRGVKMAANLKHPFTARTLIANARKGSHHVISDISTAI